RWAQPDHPSRNVRVDIARAVAISTGLPRSGGAPRSCDDRSCALASIRHGQLAPHRSARPVEPATFPSMILLADIHLTLASAAGDVNVLRGIDLDVAAGETVSITGPSGSGKSTMLMIIAGLERPSAGRVVVAGTDLGTLDEDGLARFRRD